MKQFLYLLLFVFALNISQAQISLTMLPSGGNKKASVSEQIGLTKVTIHYDRPGVKGREGKVWGELVHVGFADPEFGTSKSSPWRAGANETPPLDLSTERLLGRLRAVEDVACRQHMPRTHRGIPEHKTRHRGQDRQRHPKLKPG